MLIETDPATQFKLDRQVKTAEQELTAIQQELTQLEQQLAQASEKPNNESTRPNPPFIPLSPPPSPQAGTTKLKQTIGFELVAAAISLIAAAGVGWLIKLSHVEQDKITKESTSSTVEDSVLPSDLGTGAKSSTHSTDVQGSRGKGSKDSTNSSDTQSESGVGSKGEPVKPPAIGWIRLGAIDKNVVNLDDASLLRVGDRPINIAPPTVPKDGTEVTIDNSVFVRENFPQPPDYEPQKQKQLDALSRGDKIRILRKQAFIDPKAPATKSVWAEINWR